MSLGDPVFTMSRHEYGYDPGHNYNNPHGRWHLQLGGEKPAGAEVWHEGSEPIFMSFKEGDPGILECVRKAQATLSHFLNRFASPHEFGTFLIKIRVEEGEEHAFLWFRFET